jgi:hypothetical protein
MGIDNLNREHEIVGYVFRAWEIFEHKILAGQHQDRLGVISFLYR